MNVIYYNIDSAVYVCVHSVCQQFDSINYSELHLLGVANWSRPCISSREARIRTGQRP